MCVSLYVSVCVYALVFVALCLQDSLSNYSFIYYAKMDYPFELWDAISACAALCARFPLPPPVSGVFPASCVQATPLLLSCLNTTIPASCYACFACSTCVDVVINVSNGIKWKSTCNRIEARLTHTERVSVCVCVSVFINKSCSH